MTVAAHTGTTANGSNTTPKITVPAGASTGDVFLVHLSLNNTDVITAEPGNLHTIGTNINVSGSAQFTSRLYWGLVDGVNITPGTALTWTTSATRTWTASLEAYSGVNPTAPIHASNQVQSTSTHTAPTITTTVTSHLVEVAAFKPATATLVTSMTPAAGWGVRQSLGSASSFAPAEAVAGYDAGNPVAPGSYGGDTWTLNTTTNPEALYTVALLPAATAPNTGSAAGTIRITGSATGSRSPQGSGAGAVTFVGAATGMAPTVGMKYGSATGSLTFAGSAAGSTTRQGSASGGLTLTGAATGTTTRTGSATGTLTFAAAAHGVNTAARDLWLRVTALTDRWAAHPLLNRWATTPVPPRWVTAPLENRMATTILASAGEKQYVGGTITELTGKDISADTFQIALGDIAIPPTSWATPDVSIAGATTAQRIVKLLVSSTTAPGIYWCWVKISDNPEVKPLIVQGPITIS